MAVISKLEKRIISLLKENKAMSVDELLDQLFQKEKILFQKEKISGREVKEAIWALLEEEKIVPDEKWKMKIGSQK